MGERVLDVEVLGVVKDNNNLARVSSGNRIRSGIAGSGRDGDGVGRNRRLRDVGHDEMD